MGLTGLAFVLLFMAGLVLAFVRHPIYGLHAYMLTFYMGPETAWWGSGLPNMRWSLLSAVVTLLAVMIYRQPADRPSWYSYGSVRVLIVLALWMWIQLPWALDTEQHMFLAILFTKYVIMFAMLYAALDDVDKVYQFAMAHIIGSFWWGYLAWQYTGGGRLEDIGTGDVAGSAFASMHVSTALAFAGFFFLSFSGWKKWISFLAIPFILNAIILMQTRGAFVGLVAAAPLALLFAPPARRKMVMVYMVLGGVLFFMVADPAFWDRMSTIRTVEDQPMEASAASRFDIAEANLRMFKDHPFGVGHRGNDLLSPLYMPPSLLTPKEGSSIRSSHNTVMAILVDHGIVGILLFVLLHAKIAGAILRLRKLAAEAASPHALALAGGLATGLAIYWFNAQFANMIKAEVVIWIAAIAAALESHVAMASAMPSGELEPEPEQ